MKTLKRIKKMGSLLCFVLAFVLLYTPSAMAEWNFGIGTGPAMMAIEGDVGVHSELAGQGITLDIDWDVDEMSDRTDSAFGFGSYATNGKWTIQFSAAKLSLEGDAPARNINAYGEIEFDITMSELTAAYSVYEKNGLKFNLIGGVRYTKHELDRTLHTSNLGSETVNLDNNWTDGLIGLSLDVPFLETWSWNTAFNAGFGGSEGTYTAKTGVTWRFYKGWSSTLHAEYMAVEFEDGTKGSSGWYLWDIDQKMLGLAIMYNW